MSTDTTDRELRAANPVAEPVLRALDLGDCEAELGRTLTTVAGGEAASGGRVGVGSVDGARWRSGRRADGRQRRLRSGRPRLLLGLAGATAAAVAIVVLVVGGGNDSQPPQPDFSANLVRYAESTPLLLLELPGWHVQYLEQQSSGSGDIRFGADKGRRHQKWMRLFWLPANGPGVNWHAFLHPTVDRTPGRRFTTRLEALGVTAHVDTRAESAPQYGSPGDHEMSAAWKENGRIIFLVTRVPDVGTFLERIEGLRKVDAQTWLAAMPASVIKPMEYAPTVNEMLKGVPLPPGFDPSSIPPPRPLRGPLPGGRRGRRQGRLRLVPQLGEARAAGDAAAEAKAERVLLRSEEQWPIFREMAKEGAYPATVIEYARKLKSGSWYGKPVLKAVFGEAGLCGPGELPGG